MIFINVNVVMLLIKFYGNFYFDLFTKSQVRVVSPAVSGVGSRNQLWFVSLMDQINHEKT